MCALKALAPNLNKKYKKIHLKGCKSSKALIANFHDMKMYSTSDHCVYIEMSSVNIIISHTTQCVINSTTG